MTALEHNRLDEFEEKLDKVEGKVDQVLDALLGTELNLNKGVIRNVSEMERRIFKLEAFKNKVIYLSIGAGVAGGISITKIIEWIKLSGK